MSHWPQGPADRFPRHWPSRLLDPISWTVLERGPNNDYADEIEPQYVALSYTWKRFWTGNVQAAGVHNVSWSVPVIRRDHFTTQTQRAILQKITQLADVRFCWVDIFCLDQSHDVLEIEEVHRQSSIFHHAAKSFVWLTRTPAELLLNLQTCFGFQSVNLANGDFIKNGYNRDGLDQASFTFDSILSDPWFSSLWTLQEGLLAKSEALIISQEGHTIPNVIRRYDDNRSRASDVTPRSQDDMDIRLSLRELHSLASIYVRASLSHVEGAPKTREQSLDLCTKMRKTGILDVEIFNINRIYQLANNREAAMPSDLFWYVRSEIYDLPTRSSLHHTHHSDAVVSEVAELQLSLFSYLPAQSQLFLSTSRNRERPSWALAPEMYLPNFAFLPNYLKSHIPLCAPKATPNHALTISGLACRLDDFAKTLIGFDSAVPASLTYSSPAKLESVWLDEPISTCLINTSTASSSSPPPVLDLLSEYIHTVDSTTLINALNDITRSPETHTSSPNTPAYIILPLSRATSLRDAPDLSPRHYFVGLILEHQTEPHGHWRRRGVCFWRQGASTLLEQRQIHEIQEPRSTQGVEGSRILLAEDLGLNVFAIEDALLC